MANEVITIVVSDNGSTDVVVKKLDAVGTSSKKSADSVDILKGALAGLGAAATIKGFTDLLDTYQTATNRLSFLAKSQDEAKVSLEALFQVANNSRTSIEDTVNLYTRMTLATENMGVSHADAARVVETLQKAMAVSGASTREANAALVQLSQGMAAGTLRGRELRSVMQQIPLVADIIAEKLGVTRGALRQMGTEGKVSAEVMFQALLGASQKIDDAFAKTSPRVSDQITILQNHIIKFAGEMNEKFQIIPKITALLDFLGDHMETIGRVVLAGVFVTGVEAAIVAVEALSAAISANPIGAIAVFVLAAVAALVLFSDRIKLSAGSLTSLADFGKAVFEEIATDAKFVGKVIFEAIDKLTPLFREVFGNDFALSVKGMLTLGAKTVDALYGIFAGGKLAIIEAFKNLPAAIEAIFIGLINKTNELIEGMINGIITGINRILDSALGQKLGLAPLNALKLGRLQASAEAEDQGKAIANAFKKGFESQHDAQDLLGRLTIRADEIAKERIAKQAETTAALQKGHAQFNEPNTPDATRRTVDQVAVQDAIDKLKEEAEALKQNSVERRIENDLIRITQNLQSKGVQITNDEKEQIRNQLQVNEELKVRSKLTEQITGHMQDNALEQKQLNQIIAQGTDHLDAYVAKLRQVQIESLLMNRDLVSGFKAGFLEMQNSISDFASQGAHLVTDAYGQMQNSLVEFVKTGKMNWSSLTDSILSNMLKLLMNQAVMGIIGALGGSATGGFGGLLAGAFGAVGGGVAGAKAVGGAVAPGKSYLVGEKGPEIFSPGVGGSIVPNGAMMGGMTPNVNVHVVNVTDPNEVASAMAHPSNQDVFVNVIRKNKGAVRAALGVS